MSTSGVACADLSEICRAIALLTGSGQVVELRALGTPRRTASGYYTDPEKLARDAAALSGHAKGVYLTLNPCLPDLLARAGNHLRHGRDAEPATGDAEIAERRHILFDLDSERLGGISATTVEHDAAIARADECRTWLLDEIGVPPDSLIFADSGNGAALVLRVDLPNDPAAHRLVEQCIAAVAFRFTDGVVKVDTSVSNAARIWRLCGTLNCKGDSTTERPHRLARIIAAPAELRPVDRVLLERLAAFAPPPPQRATRHNGASDFDLDTWIADHADVVQVVRSGPWSGGRRWVLNPCPWNPAHTNAAAYIVQHSSGGIAAGCHHDGCAGKDWHALRDLAEPAHVREQRGARRRDAHPEEGPATARERRFRFYTDEEVGALPAPDPLVDGLLAMEELDVFFGGPGTGKTFIALDIGMSVGSGLPCLGRSVRQGAVAYIAAEGMAGLGLRLRAWKQRHGVTGAAGVAFLTDAPNLLAKAEVNALVEALEALEPRPILVVVDTLARCIVGGDENSAKDVGLAIAALDRIRTTLRCTVLVLHHSGKNADTERGSSALRGAADTMLALAKDGDGITVRCEKAKNTAPFEDVKLKLVPVQLEELETSCVVEVGAPPVTELSGSRHKVLRTLLDLFADDGATFTEMVKTGISESSLRRALVDLDAAGYVAKPPKSRGGKYLATPAGRVALERLTANGHGGDFPHVPPTESADRQSPPSHRHGGDHQSPPPPSPPYRGGTAWR